MKTRLTQFALCSLLALAGCRSIGPGGLTRDRYEYSDSIGESWKRQTLLNVVKLRYLDPPIFVDVGQIVASRTLSRNLSAFGNAPAYNGGPPFGAVVGNYGLSAGGTYTDQPTVTYTPLTGNRYIKSLMTPLTPDSVFFMIQAGWPADGVLVMATAAINGLKNQASSINGTTPPDPEFMRALALIRKIQLAGGVAFRIQQDALKQQTSLLTFRREDIAPEVLADAIELRRLLKLDPQANEFKLVFGATAASDNEVAMQTRSIIQLMGIMAAQVDVPSKDLTDHAAVPGWESMPSAPDAMRLIRICSSKDEPPHAFVAVPYRGQWFWIDDHDLKSKRVFSFIMLLFTLADTGEPQPMPLVTIPAH
jgi:hypothetical protein